MNPTASLEFSVYRWHIPYGQEELLLAIPSLFFLNSPCSVYPPCVLCWLPMVAIQPSPRLVLPKVLCIVRLLLHSIVRHRKTSSQVTESLTSTNPRAVSPPSARGPVWV